MFTLFNLQIKVQLIVFFNFIFQVTGKSQVFRGFWKVNTQTLKQRLSACLVVLIVQFSYILQKVTTVILNFVIKIIHLDSLMPHIPYVILEISAFLVEYKYSVSLSTSTQLILRERKFEI